MATSFRPYHPDQPFLFPPSPQDWLPEGHLAYFICEIVDQLDLRAFYRPYEGDGRRNQPYDPCMMVKILIYGYATGTFSSRKLARKLHEDVGFRMLAAGNFPEHRTLCEFRKRHLAEFQSLFEEVVRLARAAGLVKLGRVAIDGTKVKADASRHKAMSYGHMKKEAERLAAEVRELTQRAARIDEHEDGLYGPDRTGDELPEELHRREDRLRKIQEAKRRLEERQEEEDRAAGREEGDDEKPKKGRPFKRQFGVPPEKKQDNFTDPESRIMKTSSGGFDQCYNPQVAADSESQLVIATHVSQSSADSRQLIPLVDEVKRVVGEPAGEVLADSGYRSEENFEALESRGIRGYISLGREGKKLTNAPSSDHPASEKMLARLASESGKSIYRLRKAIVEPVMGWVKEGLGFRQFSVRGHANVGGEWNLVCLALNLKRLNGRLQLA